VKEPIIVEAQTFPDGRVRPLAFVWRGRRYKILSHGRRWVSDGEQRFLVMVEGEKTFELALLAEQDRWELRRSPRHFGGPAVAA
jgi:hypothetical protein